MPSLLELRRSENTATNSFVISWGRSAGTSATLPSSPIMFLRRSCDSGNFSLQLQNVRSTFKINMNKNIWLAYLRNSCIPPPSRNRLQLIGVSSVTFHMQDQAVSITSSQVPFVYSVASCVSQWSSDNHKKKLRLA